MLLARDNVLLMKEELLLPPSICSSIPLFLRLGGFSYHMTRIFLAVTQAWGIIPSLRKKKKRMRTDTSFSSQNQCLCVWRSQQVSLSLFLPRVFSLCSSPFLSSPMLLLLSSGLSPIVHTLPGVPRAHKSFCIVAEQRCSTVTQKYALSKCGKECGKEPCAAVPWHC